MFELLLAYKLIAVLVIVVAFLAWERLRPAQPRPERFAVDSASFFKTFNAKGKRLQGSGVQRYCANIGLWLINSLLSPLVALPVSLWFASEALQWRGWSSHTLVDVLLLDMWIYWWHRLNHCSGFLWRFHRIHHLDRWLDVTTAFRFHFGEVFLSALVRGIFIWSMGITWQAVLVFEILTLVCAAFHHSNSRLSPRFEQTLSRIIVTPSLHWVHHHAQMPDTNSNYGVMLSVWDRLFGSLSRTPRTLISMLGLAEENDRTLFALLLLPFTKRLSTRRERLR